VIDRSPAEGVVRQLRKGIDDRRHYDDVRVAQALTDIAAVVEVAELLHLRTPALELEAHATLMSVLSSVGETPRGKRPRRKRRARPQLPLADIDGQLTLPLGET
jgi:hypothetical protein